MLGKWKWQPYRFGTQIHECHNDTWFLLSRLHSLTSLLSLIPLPSHPPPPHNVPDFLLLLYFPEFPRYSPQGCKSVCFCCYIPVISRHHKYDLFARTFNFFFQVSKLKFSFYDKLIDFWNCMPHGTFRSGGVLVHESSSPVSNYNNTFLQEVILMAIKKSKLNCLFTLFWDKNLVLFLWL